MATKAIPNWPIGLTFICSWVHTPVPVSFTNSSIVGMPFSLYKTTMNMVSGGTILSNCRHEVELVEITCDIITATTSMVLKKVSATISYYNKIQVK